MLPRYLKMGDGSSASAALDLYIHVYMHICDFTADFSSAVPHLS